MALLLAKGENFASWRGVEEFAVAYREAAVRLASRHHPAGMAQLLELVEDQLYAFWTSILAGSIGFCYGAQGIWNAGDGIFLNHWGNQTFSQAINLDTPRLLGLSYAIIKPYLKQKSTCQIIEAGDRLLKIQRSFDNTTFTFVPEMQEAYQPPTGRIWLPLEGRYVSKLPSEGQVVIISQ